MEVLEFLEKIVKNASYSLDPMDTEESIKDRMHRCTLIIEEQEKEKERLKIYLDERMHRIRMLKEATEFIYSLKEIR